MKTMLMSGAQIKADNGSGYSISSALSKRKFHDRVVYKVYFSGVQPDQSNVTRIERIKKGWME